LFPPGISHAILLIKPKQIGDSLILSPPSPQSADAFPKRKSGSVVRRAARALSQAARHHALLTSRRRETRPATGISGRTANNWQISTHKFDFIFELGEAIAAKPGRLTRRTVQAGFFRQRPIHGENLRAKKGGITISTFDWQTCHRRREDQISAFARAGAAYGLCSRNSPPLAARGQRPAISP